MATTITGRTHAAGSEEAIRLVNRWIESELRRRDKRDLAREVQAAGSKGARKLAVARHSIKTSYGLAEL